MRHLDPLKNDKKKIIILIERINNSNGKCQLHRNSAKFLMKLGMIEEVEHKEEWGIGTTIFKFHVLTQKGKDFYEESLKKKALNPTDKFWNFVNKTDSCWIWTGPVNNSGNGYGYFTFNKVIFYAHRFSYELHKNKISENMCICHKCDNTKCVNPENLWEGTQKSNIKDSFKKNRFHQAFKEGFSHPNCKITLDVIHDIRKLRNQGVSGYEIAKKYNMSNQHVYDIANGKYWKKI